MALEEQEIVGELIDPEDVPLGEPVWVARRLDVVFDGRLGSSQSVPLASAIDTSEFVSGVLMVVVHTAVDWPSKPTLWIRALAVEVAPCNPEAVFLGPVSAQLALEDGDPPGVDVVALDVVPAQTMVRLDWEQLDSEATDLQAATISVALVVRRRVPPAYRVR